jgi:hypothetical protein
MREITNISTYSYTPYLLQDKFFGPSEKEVAEQAATGVEMNLVSCLDMSPYPLSTDEEPKVNVSVDAPMITAQISWPVRYEEGDIEVTYRSFAHSESYPAFFRFYDFAMEYSKNQTEYAPGDICLSCLERDMDQYDFSLYTEEVFFRDATMIVYVLFDENSTSGDIPLFGFSHLFLDSEVVS